MQLYAERKVGKAVWRKYYDCFLRQGSVEECETAEGTKCLPLDLPNALWLKKGVWRVGLSRLEKESLTEDRKMMVATG